MGGQQTVSGGSRKGPYSPGEGGGLGRGSSRTLIGLHREQGQTVEALWYQHDLVGRL